MRLVTKYETSDRKVFDTEKEAERHEHGIALCEWYNSNILYGNVAGSRVDYLDFIDWLDNNVHEVEELIKYLKSK